MTNINYRFIPSYKSSELKLKSDITSYAGKLLEIADCNFLIISLDENDTPICFGVSNSGARVIDMLDFTLEEY